MANTQLLNQIQAELAHHYSRTADLLTARVALLSGSDAMIDICATGLYSRTVADEPVYEVVCPYEYEAQAAAYFINLENEMQYE